jgi:hypothetical protein
MPSEPPLAVDRVCPECGAGLAAGAASCWLCGAVDTVGEAAPPASTVASIDAPRLLNEPPVRDSPLVRVVLGVIAGLVLLGVALFLAFFVACTWMIAQQ